MRDQTFRVVGRGRLHHRGIVDQAWQHAAQRFAKQRVIVDDQNPHVALPGSKQQHCRIELRSRQWLTKLYRENPDNANRDLRLEPAVRSRLSRAAATRGD